MPQIAHRKYEVRPPPQLGDAMRHFPALPLCLPCFLPELEPSLEPSSSSIKMYSFRYRLYKVQNAHIIILRSYPDDVTY
jgi:hypothetical protein